MSDGKQGAQTGNTSCAPQSCCLSLEGWLRGQSPKPLPGRSWVHPLHRYWAPMVNTQTNESPAHYHGRLRPLPRPQGFHEVILGE